MSFLTMLAVLVLPFAGEIGWVNGTTKTCLYKILNTTQMYFVVLPSDQECPKQVEIRTDDPEPAKKARVARSSL